MKKFLGLLPILFLGGLTISLAPLNNQNSGVPIDNLPEIAKPGQVAYAASYSSDITNEPKYTTQNSTTFQYLNLGSTLSQYRGDSIKVGIIDSGINYDHEDFMVNSQTKVKGDSKYYSYQTSSWVYYKASQHGYSYIDDTLGHGTNVAATVAAAVNSVGGLGLAPNVELYVYKVTNSSNGYEFGAIQNALMDAKTLGLDVINMSFQSYENAVSYNGSSMGASSGCSTILSYYLNQAYNAGITLVGAAGNYNTSEPSYPGSNAHVINVGSLNQTATGKAGFSNYGSTIDLVAPGYVYVADEASNTAYTNTQGTSFSAPLVTAAIALYKQQNPSATPDQIEAALYASCDPIDSGSTYSNWAGHGALNVSRFLGVQEDAPTEIVINNPEIVNEELSLEVGDTFDLDWTVNGNGTFDDSVDIYSYYENVISVDENGHITALGPGSDYVIIESTVDSNVYASIYVTVTAATPTVTSVSVSPTNLNLDLYGTKTGNLVATVNGTHNPAQTVTWSSSNTSVATVSSSGVVTAKAVGNATITARSTIDTSKTGTCSVSVVDTTPSLTSISVSGQKTSFVEGDSFSFGGTVTAHYSDSSSKTVSSAITYTGYNMTVVGEQTVTVAYSGKTTTYTITVSAGTLSSIAVSGQTTSYKKGDAFSFNGTCTATFINGYQKVVSPTSVSTPNMNKVGEKTVTISYLYNNVVKSTTYNINVVVARTVIEEQQASGYQTIGTVTYPNNTQTISVNSLSVTTGGFTEITNNSIRMGSNGNTGSITVSSTTSNISKVVVSAKSFGSDSSVHLTIGGSDNTLTSSYADYFKEYSTATNSVTIATTANKKRANVQTITIYTGASGTQEVDISDTEDVYNLEVFIDTYLHMDDYTENKGWCKDSEHNYYGKNTTTGAKYAFNHLNEHQRVLFTTNEAYASEWLRLQNWAEANGDSLDVTDHTLSLYHLTDTVTYVGGDKHTMIIALSGLIGILVAVSCVFVYKKKHD